ncbi:hypothetical protein LY44_01338 [Rhodobacter capsulatus]|nr:hypothetical protein AP073_14745 [Rhodobacter capsulatus]PZX25555.1 hypothetical protein LY44_01338 [Rhodobacter capsulatus]
MTTELVASILTTVPDDCGGMTDSIVDPVKAEMEAYDRDVKTAERVLFDIRAGGEVEIMYDPMTGWEMSGEDVSVYMPLETAERAVNMILRRLTRHYRKLSALRGNPDLFDMMQLEPK